MAIIISTDRRNWLRAIMFDRFGFQLRSTDIAKILGVSVSTATRKKMDPTLLTLEEAIDIANATGMTDEEWGQLRRG